MLASEEMLHRSYEQWRREFMASVDEFPDSIRRLLETVPPSPEYERLIDWLVDDDAA